jgi:hypothetical protein
MAVAPSEVEGAMVSAVGAASFITNLPKNGAEWLARGATLSRATSKRSSGIDQDHLAVLEGSDRDFWFFADRDAVPRAGGHITDADLPRAGTR